MLQLLDVQRLADVVANSYKRARKEQFHSTADLAATALVNMWLAWKDGGLEKRGITATYEQKRYLFKVGLHAILAEKKKEYSTHQNKEKYKDWCRLNKKQEYTPQDDAGPRLTPADYADLESVVSGNLHRSERSRKNFEVNKARRDRHGLE